MTDARKPARTPGPWSAEGSIVIGCGEDHQFVCDCGDPDSSIMTKVACSDAAFIARACNAHDDLVAALRELVDACAYVSPIVGAVATEAKVSHLREAGRFLKACNNARAALARATEGE